MTQYLTRCYTHFLLIQKRQQDEGKTNILDSSILRDLNNGSNEPVFPEISPPGTLQTGAIQSAQRVALPALMFSTWLVR